MRKLDPSGLWRMLRDPEATASIEQADAVLSKFALDLHRYCREERRPDECHRTLTFIRSFVTAPCQWAQGGAKCNGLHAYLSGIAAGFIDGELELVRLGLQFPKSFVHKGRNHAPLAGWKGTQADLLEMHSPVHKMGKMLKPDGEPMAYSDVIDFLYYAYGVEVSGPYDRKTKLLTRIKGGAPFLEQMIQVYLDEVDEKLK